MIRTAVISGDEKYAALLVYELQRRGIYAEKRHISGATFDVEIIDLDTFDGDVSSESDHITFSRRNGAMLKRPFAISDLVVQIENIYDRKKGISQKESIITDRISRTVCYQGKNVRLSPAEFEVFTKISQANGEVVGYDGLIGSEMLPNVNALRVCINSLREKMCSLFGKNVIVNVKGKGYRLE